MFTVCNRDVVHLVSIVVLCILLIPETLPARNSDIISKNKRGYRVAGTPVRDSYENYAGKRQSIKKQNTKSKKNSSAVRQNINSNTAPGKGKGFTHHKVRPGDTLTNIAQRYSTTVALLQSSNNLKNQNSIKSGMILKIPASRTVLSSSSKITSEPGKPMILKNTPRFQWPVHHVINYHQDGLDGVKSIGIVIVGKKGSSVFSSAPGRVKKIGSMRGFGKYVVITHSGRYSTVYANLDRINVASGDTVNTDIQIGYINSYDRKLHFQIDFEGKPENPLKYLPKNI
jgi:lipoprotein YgeR